MVLFLKNLRAGERRDALAGFIVLGALIGSHSLLEAARDALFLERLPASHLPVVYLLIAAISLTITRLQARFRTPSNQRRALQLWTGASAMITAAFWAVIPILGSAGLYALYVWSGVMTTLILVHFWTALGETFSVTEAKRAYGVVGLGSVIGAIGGSAIAAGLVPWLGARHLVLVSALGFTVATWGPRLFRDATSSGSLGKGPEKLRDAFLSTTSQPFVARLTALVFVSASVLTCADYVFKSTVASNVPREELAAFFASTYLVVNVASLTVQLTLVGPAIRRVGVMGALAVLPLALILSGASLAVVGTLFGALLLKGADGSLKHTTHRTAIELLFVPLNVQIRKQAKTLADVVGQRGGQAAASVAILALVSLGVPSAWMVGIMAIGAVVWLVGIAILRRHYVELFRRQLSVDQVAHIEEFPELDIASLESLIAALDSQDDRKVIAALDLLEREHKGHLIPSLILYHPSAEVVRHALAQLCRQQRHTALPAIDRLLGHAAPEIRGDAVAARSIIAPDDTLLRERLIEEESEEVRAVIAVNLVASGSMAGGEAEETVRAVLDRGSVSSRLALLNTIALRQTYAFFWVVQELSRATEAEVRCGAARTMGVLGSEELLRDLVELTADESTRSRAINALIANGASAFVALQGALQDTTKPSALRWRLPRIMVDCSGSLAGDTLLRQLVEEPDGQVRYGCVVALELLVRRSPELRLDRGLIALSLSATIRRALELVDARLSLQEGVAANSARNTRGHRLLDELLRDKGAHAIDRMLRLLALEHPGEDFGSIRLGLDSEDRKVRATSVELLGSILRSSLRDAVVALVDDVPLAQTLASGQRFHRAHSRSYESTLASMLESKSESIRASAVFHVGELKLDRFRDFLKSAPHAGDDWQRALEKLGALPA
ncbi:MAG: hypothetical protein AAFP04_06560 [Myxococcota bacterium]